MQRAPHRTRTAIGLAIVVVIAALYVWKWHGVAGLSMAIQPLDAPGTCRSTDGRPILFCDFAKHYYPQGQKIVATAKPVSGFYYPAPFALLMAVFAALPYDLALAVWVALGLVFVVALYALPQLDSFARATNTTAIHTLLFATSLPLLHNFVWGQVSVIATFLVLAALYAYQKERRYLAAALLAVAVAVKIYPAVFAVYFLIKRDRATLVAFTALSLVLTFILPAVVLGTQETANYYHALEFLLDQLSRFATATPYSNSLANVAALATTGRLAPNESLYQLLHAAGYILACLNAALLYFLVRARVRRESTWAAALIFTTTPFLLGTSWVHYFVYLPVVQTFAFSVTIEATVSRWLRLSVISVFLFPSILFSNIGFFLQYHRPDDYYRHGYHAWSNLLLVAALYILAASRLRQPREGASLSPASQ